VRQVKSLKEALGPARGPARRKEGTAGGGVAAAGKATGKAAAAKKAPSTTPVAKPDGLQAVIESLRKSPSRRPGSVAALGKWLVARNLPAGEVDALIERLAAANVLRVEGKKVVYAPEPWVTRS
jgi:hypothetical protein